jgi:hypothetical protein
MTKSEFIRSLQSESIALSPYQVSQRLRLACGCVSVFQGDHELDPADYRGYMLRYAEKPDRTPENPELYVCVISLRQGKAWQDLIWTKEILGVLDHPEHRTKDRTSLGHMIDNRSALPPHGAGTPANVIADKNGFTLALGCAVPFEYRKVLRKEKYLDRFSGEQLEELLLIPEEFIAHLLSEGFEKSFEEALQHSDMD